MSIEEIIRKYLTDNNFDGLFNEDEDCGCEVDDLFPCVDCCHLRYCEPGYKHKGGTDYDWVISPTKTEEMMHD